MEENLKLTIKPKLEPREGQCLSSSAYRVQVGNWVLDRGVKKMTLEMDASEMPKLTIEAEVHCMDIDAINGLDLELVDTSEHSNHPLTPAQVTELAELRRLRRSNFNFKELKDNLEQKEKQNSILSIALSVLVLVFIALLWKLLV